MTDTYIQYEYDPHKLPQDILTALGLLSACACQTESVIEMGIGGCLGIDSEYNFAVTTHMNSPLRDHVLRATAEIRIDDLDDLDLLDKILDNIKQVMKQRNSYLHRTICKHPKTGECFLVRIDARGSVEGNLIPIDAEKITADAELIYEAGMELIDFLVARNLLAPDPPGPRPRFHKTKAERKKRREALLKKGD